MPEPRRLVVGAVLVDALDAPTLVLAARRSCPPELAGRWEFPGGKVEAGESPPDALVRELREELGIIAVVGDEVPHPDGAWPISERYELRLFLTVTEDVPSPGDSHAEVRWLAPAELDELDWLPSDRAAIGEVRARLSRVAPPGSASRSRTMPTPPPPA